MKLPDPHKYNTLFPMLRDTNHMVVYAIRHNWTGLFWGLQGDWTKYPKLYVRLDRVERAITAANMDVNKISVISWELRDPMVVDIDDLNLNKE